MLQTLYNSHPVAFSFLAAAVVFAGGYFELKVIKPRTRALISMLFALLIFASAFFHGTGAWPVVAILCCLAAAGVISYLYFVYRPQSPPH